MGHNHPEHEEEPMIRQIGWPTAAFVTVAISLLVAACFYAVTHPGEHMPAFWACAAVFLACAIGASRCVGWSQSTGPAQAA
jgi:hypothetical protein